MEYIEEVIKSLLPEDLFLVKLEIFGLEWIKAFWSSSQAGEAHKASHLIVRKSHYDFSDNVKVWEKAPKTLCVIAQNDSKLHVGILEINDAKMTDFEFYKDYSLGSKPSLKSFQLNSECDIVDEHTVDMCNPCSIKSLKRIFFNSYRRQSRIMTYPVCDDYRCDCYSLDSACHKSSETVLNIKMTIFGPSDLRLDSFDFRRGA